MERYRQVPGARVQALHQRQRPRRLAVVGFFLIQAVALLSATAGSAQEKRVSLVFTEALLSRIATDNQGEQTAEIVGRIIGLSPTVLSVGLQRAGGRVSLFLTARGDDELPLNFQFTLDKMVYYRMRAASADINGVTEALQEAKAAEPLLREVGYRYDGRYSTVDLVIDLRAAIEAAREMQGRRDAEKRDTAVKAAPSPKGRLSR